MSNALNKVIIIGRSGSGKTTLVEKLINFKNARIARLHTSRKKRKHEDASDYHFVSHEFFKTNKEDFMFIERFQDTEDKLYGLTREEYAKSNIIIFAPEYFQYLSKEELSEICVVLMDISRPECIRRQLSRGDEPDKVIKRAENDDISFNTIAWHISENLNISEVYKIKDEESEATTIEKIRSIICKAKIQ
jgi:guanylate kinase